ncbi:MAG: hypothetical protein AAGD43_32510 [Pseudomonadota bacterium]
MQRDDQDEESEGGGAAGTGESGAAETAPGAGGSSGSAPTPDQVRDLVPSIPNADRAGEGSPFTPDRADDSTDLPWSSLPHETDGLSPSAPPSGPATPVPVDNLMPSGGGSDQDNDGGDPAPTPDQVTALVPPIPDLDNNSPFTAANAESQGSDPLPMPSDPIGELPASPPPTEAPEPVPVGDLFGNNDSNDDQEANDSDAPATPDDTDVPDDGPQNGPG